MNDQTVDLNTWGRGKLFRFYMERMRIVMSLTVEMDVTALVRFTKNRRLKSAREQCRALQKDIPFLLLSRLHTIW